MFRLDPSKITNFNCTDQELELHILFWICASFKAGMVSARCLCNMLNYWNEDEDKTPFEIIRHLNRFDILPRELKKFGIGCFNKKAEYMTDLVSRNLNLRTCSVQDLESVKGIKFKSSRCFVLHTRPNQEYAGLDRHALNFLKEKGHVIPKSLTRKNYEILEKIFLNYVHESEASTSEFDLNNWNSRRK